MSKVAPLAAFAISAPAIGAAAVVADGSSDDEDDASIQSAVSSSIGDAVGVKTEAKLDDTPKEETLKDRVIREVLEEVMPDIGAFDIDGTVEERATPSKGRCIRCLKVFGLIDLEIHEAVLSGSLYHVQRSVNKIKFKKNKSGVVDINMINQYDDGGQVL
jgi:hypothetical protein